MKVLIHVNHMLGTGHAVRACRIGRAMLKQGATVTIATGNIIPETIDSSGLEIIDLPLAKSNDFEFSGLVDEFNRPVDEMWKYKRANAFMEIWKKFAPDVLITEHFPFGRGKLKFELVPVLSEIKKSKPETLIVASIRDILVKKDQPEKELRMVELAEEYFDLIVVHSDDRIVRLEESFRFANRIESLVWYTGYIVGDAKVLPAANTRSSEIVVSSGGGAFGLKLIETAIEVAKKANLNSDFTWRILCGPNISDCKFKELQKEVHKGTILERNRTDFQQLLANASCSISQAGYNTCLDILTTGVAAVLVPSPVNGNEQTMRADKLANLGLVKRVAESELTVQSLTSAVVESLTMNPAPHEIKLDDGSNCCELIFNELQRKRQKLRET